MVTTAPVDWTTLRQKAKAAAEHAYAPYSGLKVGASGLMDGEVYVTGCNVENASFGLTLCAECGLVSDMYRLGGGSLSAISVVDQQGTLLWPCGRCRQLLSEVGASGLLVDAIERPVRLDSILPNAFGAQDLPAGEAE